jgi:hypothetical protein
MKQVTLDLNHWVPAGTHVFDHFGHLVGTVQSIAQKGADSFAWLVVVEVDDGADTTALQVMPQSGITGSINNA